MLAPEVPCNGTGLYRAFGSPRAAPHRAEGESRGSWVHATKELEIGLPCWLEQYWWLDFGDAARFRVVSPVDSWAVLESTNRRDVSLQTQTCYPTLPQLLLDIVGPYPTGEYAGDPTTIPWCAFSMETHVFGS